MVTLANSFVRYYLIRFIPGIGSGIKCIGWSKFFRIIFSGDLHSLFGCAILVLLGISFLSFARRASLRAFRSKIPRVTENRKKEVFYIVGMEQSVIWSEYISLWKARNVLKKEKKLCNVADGNGVVGISQKRQWRKFL